ncbi:hypothetical protein OUZ56_023275 [Daphnia magna]|uniref:Kazal-like domain-containing protein n=1 Tax=Daphnia magna TaxID=35525 RepID=A0ABR0AYW5_9CRUS|nr:hypothetical protein OUZ56_023275 [Daphnia magna]
MTSSTKTIIQVSLLLLQLLQEPEVIPIDCFTQPSGTICETFYNSLEMDCNVGYTPSCQKRTSPPGLYLIHNSFCFAKYLRTRYPNPIEFNKNTEDLYAIS